MDERRPEDDQAEDASDALAARIADAVLELARKPGAHRLAAMQMAGLASERPTHRDIARAFACPVREIVALERRAFLFIAWKFPELRDELRALRRGEPSG